MGCIIELKFCKVYNVKKSKVEKSKMLNYLITISMLILLSPAKSLNYVDKASTKEFTQPMFTKEVEQLVNVLKKYSPKKIGELMDLSAELSDLNYQRYQSFEKTYNLKNAKQCLFAFTGEVYKGLEADSLTQKDIAFAQQHLRHFIWFVWCVAPPRFNATLSFRDGD
jgi:hypothetical protein